MFPINYYSGNFFGFSQLKFTENKSQQHELKVIET